MTAPARTDPTQRGAITIMVVLMLLVLLTISSLAMSKNAVRSAIASGSLRQVHMAENVADSGIEWAVYWMNSPTLVGSPTGGALTFQNQMLTMQQAANFGIANTTITSTDFNEGTINNAALSYNVTLDLLGQTQPYFQGASLGMSTTAQQVSYLNVWTVTVNGKVTYPNGVTFTNRRQAWVTAPPF